MIERTRMAFVLAVLCSALLSACGGGGSGGGGGGGGGTPLSGNANLAALTVTGADLEQAFDPGSTAYTAVVGFLIDSIQVDASAQHGAATVEVDGAIVAAGGVTVLLAEGDNDIVVEVTAEDGTTRGYTLTVTRQSADAFAQDAYVKASNTGENDLFGYSVALSGDTLAVGAFGEESAATGVNGEEADNSASVSGAVYVFTRDAAGLWSQQAYVKASNAEAGDGFGLSVALSGDTLAVGALFEDSVATGIDGDEADNNASASGAVYVFTRDGAGVWSQQAYVKSSNAGADDQFGYSVALSGDTLAVGANREDSAATGIDGDEADNNEANSGAVYVFTRDGAGLWSQQAYVKASNTGAAGALFGISVALSGDTLAVGANRERSAATGIDGDESDSTAPDSGAVYLFTRNDAGAWEQQAYVKASNTQASDAFGQSVALSGDTLAAGAYQEDSAATGIGGDEGDNTASGSGAVYLFGGVPMRNPDLSSLQIEGVDFDQIFQPNQTDYTAVVGFLSGSARLDALAEDANAVVRVNGTRIDAAGAEVSLEEGDNTVEIEVTAEDGVSTALYTLTITRQSANAFAQDAYVKASNTEAGDYFGFSVALSGDTLAVGAIFEDSVAAGIDGDEADNNASASGAVYVFTRDGAGLWSQQAYVKASNAGAGDWFGRAVALLGDTLAVGAIFEDSAATGIDGDESNNDATDAGAVYLFTRDGAGLWSQQAYVKASNAEAGDGFGRSVALSGDTLAVGANREGSAATGIDGDEADNNALVSGAVYLFARDGAGDWEQQSYVKASNAEADDQFGISIALSGDTLAVGANREDSAAIGIDGDEADNNAPVSGAVYVFARDGAGVWSQQAYVKASNAEAFDEFGFSIALSDDTLAVGANREDSAATGMDGDESDNTTLNSGAVYVFTRDDAGDWSQQAYVKASNAGANLFGDSVALSGDTLAVGATREDSAATGINGDEGANTAPDSGAVYVLTRDGAGLWSQQAYVKASNTGELDLFGFSVALSGDTLAVGAYQENSAATGVYGDESSDSAPASGAVYVFD